MGSVFRRLADSEEGRQTASTPPSVDYGTAYVKHLFVFLIGFAYSPISPVVSLFVCFYFVLGSVTAQYQCVYLFCPKYETNGLFFPQLLDRLAAVVAVSVLSLIGVFGLKKNAAVFFLAIPLLPACWLLRKSMKRYSERFNYLPLSRCVQLRNKINSQECVLVPEEADLSNVGLDGIDSRADGRLVSSPLRQDQNVDEADVSYAEAQDMQAVFLRKPSSHPLRQLLVDKTSAAEEQEC